MSKQKAGTRPALAKSLSRLPAAKPKPATTNNHTPNGESVSIPDIDAAIRASNANSLLVFIEEIEQALIANDPTRAQHQAEFFKDEFFGYPGDEQRDAFPTLQARIETIAEAIRGAVYELTGLPRPKPADDGKNLQERTVDDLLLRASKLWGQERDDLILHAARTLAAMPSLTIMRYQSEFARVVQIDSKSYNLLIRQARNQPSTEARAEIIGGQLCWLKEPQGNFAPRITHEFVIYDGFNSAPAVRCVIEGELATGEKLPPLDLAAEDLDSPKWISKWGTRPTLYNGPRDYFRFLRALKEISASQLKREIIYACTGEVKIDGEPAFLTTTGAITANGIKSDVRVNLGEGRMSLYALPEPPADPRAAVRALLGFLDLAPYRVTVPLLSAMFSAQLTTKYPLNVLLWLYGMTQSLKSTLAILALTTYGPGFINGRRINSPVSWLASLTALEASMFAAKDVPLIIDNYTPQFTSRADADKMRSKAHEVAFVLGDRNIRARGRRDGEERKQRPPRGLIISTSEMPLDQQSIVGRMLYIPVGRSDVKATGDPNALDEAQALAAQGLYAQANAALIQWRLRNRERVEGMLSADYAAATREARAHQPRLEHRLEDCYAVLFLGIRLLLTFALECKAITLTKYNTLNTELPKVLLDLMEEQSKRTLNETPIIKTFEALSSQLTQRRAVILKRKGDRDGRLRDETIAGWYGEENNKPVLYFLTDSLITLARDYWSKLGPYFDVKPDTLRGDILQAGLLYRRDKDQLQVKEWMDAEAKTTRVLVVDARKLEKHLGYPLYPPEDIEPL